MRGDLATLNTENQALIQTKQSDAQQFAAQFKAFQELAKTETKAKIVAVLNMQETQYQTTIKKLEQQHQQDQEQIQARDARLVALSAENAQAKQVLQQWDGEKSLLLAQIAALKKERSGLTERLQEKIEQLQEKDALLAQLRQARSPLPGRLEPGGKSISAAKMAEQLLLLSKLHENMLAMQSEIGDDVKLLVAVNATSSDI